MKTENMEDIVGALQATVRKAQASLDADFAQAKRLRKVIDIDEDGQPEFLTWECRLPSGDGGERNHTILRLPWPSLNPTESYHVTELSLQFDGELKERRSRRAGPATDLLLKPIRATRSGRQGTMRFSLTLAEANEFAPDVTIDERPLDDFLEALDAPTSSGKPHNKLARRAARWIGLIIAALAILLATFLVATNAM